MKRLALALCAAMLVTQPALAAEGGLSSWFSNLINPGSGEVKKEEPIALEPIPKEPNAELKCTNPRNGVVYMFNFLGNGMAHVRSFRNVNTEFTAKIGVHEFMYTIVEPKYNYTWFITRDDLKWGILRNKGNGVYKKETNGQCVFFKQLF